MNLHNENLPDILGWCACLLMLATFCCQRPQPLRLFAVAANLAFIAYGLTADLAPVLALHLTLLPVNLYRLSGLLRGRHQSGERPKEFDHSMPAANQAHHLATYRANLRKLHRAGRLGRGKSRGDIGLDLPAHQKSQDRQCDAGRGQALGALQGGAAGFPVDEAGLAGLHAGLPAASAKRSNH